MNTDNTSTNAVSKKILVVDDNEVNCIVTETMLKILNFDVSIAYSGDEALEIANQTPFDLILMDWQMPEMDGFQASSKIWAESRLNQKTRIVAVTAHCYPEALSRCMRHGFSDVITKPFDLDMLSGALQRIFH